MAKKELVLFLEEAKIIQPIGTITFKATFFLGGEGIPLHCTQLCFTFENRICDGREKKGNNKQKRFVTFNWNIHTIFHKFCQNILPPFFVCDLWYDKASKDFANYFHSLCLYSINFSQFFFTQKQSSFFSPSMYQHIALVLPKTALGCNSTYFRHFRLRACGLLFDDSTSLSTTWIWVWTYR